MGDGGDGEMEDTPLNQLGFPVVLKARRHYDGQGTFVVKDIDALKHRFSSKTFGTSASVLLEEFVPFERNWH